MQKKNTKIIKAQIVILVVILLIIILPQIIGTTTIATTDGAITDLKCFDNMTAATVTDDECSNSFSAYYPNSKSVNYDNSGDAVDALISGDCDYMVCEVDNAIQIRREHKELMIYPEDLSILFNSQGELGKYVICRKSDYAFGITDKSLDDCNREGVTIACLSGSSVDTDLKERFPNATINYYNTNLDVYSAAATGNADFACGYCQIADNVLPEFKSLAKIYEPIAVVDYSFVAPKTDRGAKVVGEFNQFIKDIVESGEYDKLCDKWNEGNENNYHLEDYNYTGENGTLNIVTAGEWVPMTFFYDNEIVGLFVEVTCKFCAEYGYTPNITVTDYASELAGISVGKYDFMADIASETEERKESAYLTEKMYRDIDMMYTAADEFSTKSVSRFSNTMNTLKEKTTKTFITQNRYVVFLKGLGTTILISVLSAVFGTILGAIICFIRMSKMTYLQAFGRLYIKIAQGMPIVVLLLLLFYVIFSGTPVTGFWVCVIGFSLDFSAYVAEIFRSGIEAVDPGQKKAALALGFNNRDAFINVVVPQAARHILPVYSGQFISLVKMTSVAGYIAVQDLTKVSDLVRSATYEAFFPLIATAIIYFLLASLLILILKLIESKTDIAKRSRIPKGVKVND